jgi:hypothetical protein
MAMIVSRNGKDARKVERSSIKDENYLQEYIHNNPESIPLYDIKEDLRLLIVAREFPTDSGPVDAVGIDQDGELYLVETKLYRNPDKRQVVAQVLDYGASLWHATDSSGFLEEIGTQVKNTFHVSLDQKLRDFFGINEEQVTVLLDNVRRNFLAGKFRFVVLMDTLHGPLKNLVAFINQNSQFDIFAVEMEYYKQDDYEFVIPRLFGAEVKKPSGGAGSSGKRKKWDEKTFTDDAKRRLLGADLEAVMGLYEFSKQTADEIGWGTGADRGSINPRFSKAGARSPYTLYSDGTLQLNFGWLNDNEAVERFRHRFAQRVANLKGISLPKNCEETWVNIPVQQWAPVLDEFKKVFEGLIGA